MRIIILLFLLSLVVESPLRGQSAPIILFMDVEEVPANDEIIAHLRVIEFDSMIAHHIGLQWDTAKVQFIGIEDEGPLNDGTNSYKLGLLDVNNGFIQNIWIEHNLFCTSLDSGDVIFSLRFHQHQQGAVFTLLADTSVLTIGKYGTYFETIGCDGKLKDVIYVNNAGDTMNVHNGIILSQVSVTLWPELELFPNPAVDLLQVRGLGDLGGDWWLLDNLGRIVRKGSYAGDQLAISLEHLMPGQYYLNVQGHDQRHAVRTFLVAAP